MRRLPPISPTIEKTLDNGLRVVLRPDPSVPIVGIALYYDVGSRDEEPGRSGYAHLFEHLMFQGSANVPKGGHFAHIQAWGGKANGTTSQDRTNYFCSLPASELGLGLWLEADRMAALALTPESFENQRQTVIEERNERVDNAPYGKASLEMQARSYASWAYAHPVIGDLPDLLDARFDQAAAFHQRWYRPQNAVLAVAGDLDPAAAMGLIEELFGDIAPGPPRPPPPVAPGVRPGWRGEVADPLARLSALMLNHPAPAFDHADMPIFEVIEALLFRGTSSRLWRRVIIEEAAALQLSGGYECHRGESVFSLFAALPAQGPGAADRVAALYAEELDRLATTPVSAAELHRVGNQLRAAKVFAGESVLGVALGLGRDLLYHGDPAWEEGLLRRIAAVTPDDILRVARAAFSPASAVRLDVVPA